jgi:hypothetical protein
MGKRELLLIVAFVFLGTILYHATAPPSPDGRGFSLRGLIDNIRREVGPRHEYLADERKQAIVVPAGVLELRVAGAGELHIEGADRDDIAASLQVYSTGIDENEARQLGKKTSLQTSSSGDLVLLELDYPPEGRQRVNLTLTIPRRLRVRVARASRLEARGVAGFEFDNTRGTATLRAIDGSVRGTHTGGELIVEEARQVDLTVRRSELTLTRIGGTVRLDLTGGQLIARDISGDVEIDGNRVGIELERVSGTLRADLAQGSLEASALRKQARVDARGTELRFELEEPVAISAITTDETISVRLPEKGGFTLDATVESGEIRLPEGAPAPSRSQDTSTARGDLRGGGPALALRTSHADIVVR